MPKVLGEGAKGVFGLQVESLCVTLMPGHLPRNSRLYRGRLGSLVRKTSAPVKASRRIGSISRSSWLLWLWFAKKYVVGNETPQSLERWEL